MSTRLADYDYDLPVELIAQRARLHRPDSRMMVLDRRTESIEHRPFTDLQRLLSVDDLLVLNNSRVLPARHFSDDGTIEFLFTEKLGPACWKALVKPGRKYRTGRVTFIRGIRAESAADLADGSRTVMLSEDIDLFHGGMMPLPPYIRRPADVDDESRYQTVFASSEGSLAAPTAGLHFSPELLRNTKHAFVTLHVGTGTFRPVKTNDITKHEMHSERFSVSPASAAMITGARRILAVGTTTLRVLESVHRKCGAIRPVEGETDIFIYPPFEFRAVGALLTNFHMPRSTLLMLVSAFAGREFVLRAYGEAVRACYRFFSYGDCMLIL